MITEKHILEEAKNLRKNGPLFPGDSISHRTLNELIKRGWAKRDKNGNVVATDSCPYRVVGK